MKSKSSFVDIHCHLLPGLDEGPASWQESVDMARIACGDGIGTVIATTHQLSSFSDISPGRIRELVRKLGQKLLAERIPLAIAPGAVMTIQPDLLARLDQDKLITLADQRRHLLIEFPQDGMELLEPLIQQLTERKIQPIFSHPERNRRVVRHWSVVEELVERGALFQITASALTGAFGVSIRSLTEWLVQERLTHFIASDANGTESRMPVMSRAFHRVTHLTDVHYAQEVCTENPRRILAGEAIPVIERRNRRYGFSHWFKWRKAG